MASKWQVIRRLSLIFLPLVTAFAQNTTTEQISAAAETYLNHALDVMQQHAMHSQEIDWTAVRSEALKRADGAQTTVDTYPAIYFALTQLREHHSFLTVPENLSYADKVRTHAALEATFVPYTNQFPRAPDSPYRLRTSPAGHMVHVQNLEIAFVVLPACPVKHSKWQDNLPDFRNYADSVHAIASDLESNQPDGWIIDLRGNTGGNMWPMLAGIGFVLGEGRLGSFVTPNGKISNWSYLQGKVETETGGAKLTEFEIKESPLALPSLPPVAVLIDSGTASSGEALAISFAGRSSERSFGTHSFGLSTSNSMFLFSDGATLWLNTAFEVDRLNRRYDEGIEPDVVFPEPQAMLPEASDPVLRAAEQWLASQKSE